MIIGHFWDASDSELGWYFWDASDSELGWFSHSIVRVDKQGAGFSMDLTWMSFLARIYGLI